MSDPEPQAGSAGPQSTPSDKPAGRVADPPQPLPTAAVLVATGLEIGLGAALVWGAGRTYGWTGDQVNGAIVGGVTASLAVLAAFLAIQPWKSRPAADWALFWLGSATVRLLFTPLALFSVYSATLLPGAAVLLGGAAMFFIGLVTETVIIARAVLQSAGHSDRGTS